MTNIRTQRTISTYCTNLRLVMEAVKTVAVSCNTQMYFTFHAGKVCPIATPWKLASLNLPIR